MLDALPPALLLDLDDTILAFSANTDLCWRTVCARLVTPDAGFAPEALLEAILVVRKWFWADRERHRVGRLALNDTRRQIVALALERLGAPNPALAAEIGDAYARERAATLRPFPGAIETLHRLRARGVRLALLTNGNTAEQRDKIERFRLAPLFECIVVEGEFGVGKPDERVYRHALACLGIPPAEAWMVGDNLEWDVQGAQQVGIYAIWMDHAGRGLPPDSPIRPDRIIHTLAELVPAIP